MTVLCVTGIACSGHIFRPGDRELPWKESKRRVVDVTDFGARGNGKADDTASLQRAIDTVGPEGGTIEFPCGTYVLAGNPIYIPYSNLMLKGDVTCSIINQTSSSVGALLLGSDKQGSYVRVHDIRISGLSLRGSATGEAVSVGINVLGPKSYARNFGGAYNISVDGCSLSGWSMGTMATGATGFWVSGTLFTAMRYVASVRAGGYGVLTQSCYNVHIDHNRFVALPAGDRHAIYVSCDPSKGRVYQSQDVYLTDNEVDWSTPTGATHCEAAVVVRSVQNAVVSGNSVRGGYSGIQFYTGDGYGSSDNIAIVENHVWGGLSSGAAEYAGIVLIHDSSGAFYGHVLVDRNVITQTSEFNFGVTLASCRSCTVSNNIISVQGRGSSAIELYSTDTVQLGPNILDGNGTAKGDEYLAGTNVNVIRLPGVAKGFRQPDR